MSLTVEIVEPPPHPLIPMLPVLLVFVILVIVMDQIVNTGVHVLEMLLEEIVKQQSMDALVVPAVMAVAVSVIFPTQITLNVSVKDIGTVQHVRHHILFHLHQHVFSHVLMEDVVVLIIVLVMLVIMELERIALRTQPAIHLHVNTVEHVLNQLAQIPIFVHVLLVILVPLVLLLSLHVSQILVKIVGFVMKVSTWIMIVLAHVVPIMELTALLAQVPLIAVVKNSLTTLWAMVNVSTDGLSSEIPVLLSV